MRRKLIFIGLLWGIAVCGSTALRPRLAWPPSEARAEVHSAQARPADGAPLRFSDASDYVEIDGAKNPEMIPQWSTWSFAFRVIAGGSRLIPTVVLRHLSPEEAALLLEQAEADQRVDDACQERVLKLRPLLLAGKAAVINEKTREIQLDCRRQTLRLRDGLLERLGPDGRAALIQWVESTKNGMHVSVPKRELAHFQQPE